MRKLLSLILVLVISSSVALSDIDAGTWYVYTDFNDTITETSDCICEDCTSKKAKANAIYNWIRRNIMWNLAWFLKHYEKGEVYYVRPAYVIEEGYGICTDQAAVAYMLLRAQGIPAAIAVVNDGAHAVCLYMIHNEVYKMDFTACTNAIITGWEDLPLYYD